ncbi:hypothetical protein EUA93_18865 [Nocardioides oleivorans]|uniref:Phage tail tape measure protein n=1 Tax=Nocardioides oleivorans TaxID=273676 RepID=A0A4Q2RQP2_9ACTN|nr:hypothetical protein [Nocardioides oleivorans]RYB90998.1 hypothetical protein EUA93_18865 [Nocardioides oleivorans]
MAARPVKIAFLADTSDLRSSLSQAETAMDSAAAQARTSGDRIDSAFSTAAAGADATASASSQAAGGLGDLAGALEATGLISEGTAAKMETASAAIMGVTGASDLLNLATEKIPGLQKAATVATNGLAAAKRALGVAIRFALGPIGLIIAGAALLAAGFVLLYKKNETFRNIVNAVWDKVQAVIGKVVDWFTGTAGPAIRNAITTLNEKFNAIRDKVSDIVGSYSAQGGGVLGKLHSMIDTITGLGGKITSAASGMWDGLGNSFKGVINRMIGWWNNLSFSVDIPDKIPGLPDSFSITTPNIPYLANGGIVTRPTLAVIGEAGPEAVVPLNGRYGMGPTTVINMTVSVPVTANPAETGREIQRTLEAYFQSGGRRLA